MRIRVLSFTERSYYKTFHAGYQCMCSELEHCFQRLTKVNATGVIHLSPDGVTVYLDKQPVVLKESWVQYCCKKSRNHVGSWTVCRFVIQFTEKTLFAWRDPYKSFWRKTYEKTALYGQVKWILFVIGVTHGYPKQIIGEARHVWQTCLKVTSYYRKM